MMASDKRRDTEQYWNARLKRMGLTPDAGEPVVWLSGKEALALGFADDGKPFRWMQYGHEVTDLDFDGRKAYAGERTGSATEWSST